MTRKPANLPASISGRLRNIAREKHTNLDFVLRRYAIERLLYRMSVSAHRDRFVLKGAMLFTAWLDDPFRPTQDLDLLGFGDAAVAAMTAALREICAQAVDDDGLIFDAANLAGAPIREDQIYGGVRVRTVAFLGKTRIPVQIDIGFGDAITPAATELAFPALLDTPAPVLRAYPKETVVAEKFQAIAALGLANSRMKDYYDLLALSRLFAFDGPMLRDAITATFARRSTGLPEEPPAGLQDSFAADRQKIEQWTAFTGREPLLLQAGDLASVAAEVRDFVMPPARAARRGTSFLLNWDAGGPWRDAGTRT
jgi:predicted nucleotidyltransferase component of viral defense system